MKEPKKEIFEKMVNFANTFAERSGTVPNPNEDVRMAVIQGLASHVDELGKPLCPCNFYPNKEEEVKRRRWICACDEMQ
ncbi:MAG: ferredoxin-thioredoxin reductase catalytic domain-containing protein, partial [Hydrogenothermaceae bacterium]